MYYQLRCCASTAAHVVHSSVAVVHLEHIDVHMSCAASIRSNNMTMVCVQHGKEQRLLTCRIMHCEKSDGTGAVTLYPVQLTSKY